MKKTAKIIPFPAQGASFPLDGHTFSRGGMRMEVKNRHPEYADEKERLERLQEIKTACASKLCGLGGGNRTA